MSLQNGDSYEVLAKLLDTIEFNDVIKIIGNFEDGKYSIDSPFEGSFLVMASQEQGVIEANKKYNLKLRTLYNIAGLQFVFPDPLIKGNYQIVPAEDKDNVATGVGVEMPKSVKMPQSDEA